MEYKNYSAAQVYKETKIKTADGGKIIVLLYEEIDKHLAEAYALFQQEPIHHYYDKINHHITKAQKIITELMASLDSSKSQEIYDNLLRLYIYFNEQLNIANVEKKIESLEEVQTHIKTLLDAWKIAAESTAGNIQQQQPRLDISS